jgi:hypothetical protein
MAGTSPGKGYLRLIADTSQSKSRNWTAVEKVGHHGDLCLDRPIPACIQPLDVQSVNALCLVPENEGHPPA